MRFDDIRFGDIRFEIVITSSDFLDLYVMSQKNIVFPGPTLSGRPMSN